ncbi:RNA-binding protein RO60-like isoform X1 [Athalia rosae]|uniref:RNA-binding protein RO60-like isoform X1 n=1 Tax=Athalia rosae TaxID=37344 RepID=UPI00203440F4|nr:RNA-binding protein RO60-like isoform X1 [Athalia rosae]XP_012253969.2 RNA-binding protein RO60-like isoform X1 [Athalia rosae]
MAESMQSGDHSEQPEVHFTQYLFVGKEYPNYQPGCWFVHKYYEQSRVTSIGKLAERDNPLVPIELIKKAFDSGMVPNPETLVFALALCARQKKESLRHAAYDAVKTICTTPQHFILFTKFASELAKSAPEPKHGWGSGWRKAASDWYLSKDAMELAKCVTRYKGRYGWSHKDIIKLSHPKTTDIAKQAVLKYILFGLKVAKQEFSDKPDAAEVLEYIQKVEDFKHCEDEVVAGRLLEIHNLSLEHVPGHLLKSREVWNSLIPTMSITMLLNNLQRIHNIGLLKPYAVEADKIIDVITDKERLIRENVHPALVLITIKNYEKSGKPLSYEKQKVKDAAKKPSPPPIRPNRKIIETLYKTLGYSFDLQILKPTGLQYMITIDMSKAMQESRVWQCGNINAAEAGCLIALCLLRCEKNVTVATFKNTGVHIVNLDKMYTNASLGQIFKKMKQMPTGPVNLEKPIIWAAQEKKKYDVFINVVDVIDKRFGNGSRIDNPRRAIKNYRSKMSQDNAKLVTCAMTTPQIGNPIDEDKNVLTICGFDANVPKIIEAFARSLF